MSYPDHLGPDPEHTTHEHLNRFKATIARWTLHFTEAQPERLIQQRELTLMYPSKDLYFRVHQEYYGMAVRLSPEQMVPAEFGDVTIVSLPQSRRDAHETAYVAAAYRVPEGRGVYGIELDYARVERLETPSYVSHIYIPAENDGDDRAERFFGRRSFKLPAGSASYRLHRVGLETLVDETTPEDFDVSADEAAVINLEQRKLRAILVAVAHAEPDS